MEIPTVIASFCWSLPICKKFDLLFWITLKTSDHFHLKWLRVLLRLLPYHIEETNFITQLILEIKLTICCHFGHVQAYLSTSTWSSQPILSASWTSNHIQKFNFTSQVFCEILWFKESCILRFLDHNSRTRFLQTCCFDKKYKKTLALRAEVRKQI